MVTKYSATFFANFVNISLNLCSNRNQTYFPMHEHLLGPYRNWRKLKTAGSTLDFQYLCTWQMLMPGKSGLLPIYEPWYEIFNNVVWATTQASDQPAHLRSLIRAFACSLSIL